MNDTSPPPTPAPALPAPAPPAPASAPVPTEPTSWIELTEEQSRSVAKYGLDSTGALIVEYRKGTPRGIRRYRYPDTPSGTLESIQSAPRPGEVIRAFVTAPGRAYEKITVTP